MTDDRTRRRMDLVVSKVSEGNEPGIVKLELVPDPRRYEWCDVDGERCLFDRLEREMIPERVWAKGWETIGSLPIYYQPAKISDAAAYVESRRDRIKQALDGRSEPEQRVDLAAEFLDAHADTTLGFAVLCVDLVGSTQLSAELKPDIYARIIATLLTEMSRVVPLFNGQVLKYTGDGLIAFFPEPSFFTKNDLAVDCALTLRRLILTGFNPHLRAAGLAPLALRIGLEAGDAFVVTLGSPETKRQTDIIGAVVNVAAKVQALAKPDSIYLGSAAVSALHTSRRLELRPVETGTEWKVRQRDGSPYLVFEMRCE